MRTSLRHPCILALVTLATLVWSAPPVRAASMLAPQDIRPKDFSLVKKDGVYHLFYIRHNDLFPPFATENDFGHAVSTDLYHWTQLSPVMAVDPHGWDNLHMWAPHVIAVNGLYWMFYTGVTETPGQFVGTQRIGLAVSNDLMTWNRVGTQPVWDTRAAPWAWWAPLNSGVACRDPFVMEDPGAPGQFLLYYTASPASDTLSTLVAVARSPNGDFQQWVDEKPLWITHHSYSFNTLTESPHLFQHNGRWFMFITTNAGQSLSFFVGSNPLGEPASWTYRGRLANMLGVDTSLWFASEYLRDGTADLFAYCAADRIEIRHIVWGTGDNFALIEPAFFHVVSMDWSRPTALEREPIALKLTTANWYAFGGHLVAFVQNQYGREVPAPLDSLGLPATPALASDTTLIGWSPRRWPSTLDPGTPMFVRVAIDDGSATTPWLMVLANPRGPSQLHGPTTRSGDPPGNDAPQGETPRDTLRSGAAAGATRAGSPGGAGRGLALRTLAHTPFGGGPAVAFELARPSPVRADVFDLQGRRVVTLADRGFAAGAQVLTWNGCDAAGTRVGRGLYFVRVRTPALVSGTRVLLDR
ncbi:MAG TPA: hypothetical protein VI504_14850 [Candidatus Eisenbacteria bacterium]